MFKQIFASILKSYRQETLTARWNRMAPGAIYGSLAAAVFVVVSSVINVLFFPNMHLGVDWINLLTHLFEYGIALALAGAIVGWFTENYMGIVGGGVVLTILVLFGNLIASLMGRGSADLTIQSFFTAVPLVGAGILLAWLIRVAINRHVNIAQQEQPVVRRKQFVQLVIIVIFVGIIPGVLSRFGYSSENSIRILNDGLQNFSTDPFFEQRYPFEKVPALKDHFGQNYTLFASPSSSSSDSLDITIRFEDGYTITCLLPVTSGNAMFLNVCNEGTKIISP